MTREELLNELGLEENDIFESELYESEGTRKVKDVDDCDLQEELQYIRCEECCNYPADYEKEECQNCVELIED
jgi:hypothetical protein